MQKRFWALPRRIRMPAACVLGLLAALLLWRSLIPASSAVSATAERSHSSSYYSPNENTSQEKGDDPHENLQFRRKAEAPYTIRAYGNQIAIFRSGSLEPVYVSHARWTGLPAEDQALLQSGIPADSLTAAQKQLEDYT